MSPRPYQLGKRQDLVDESRRRVLDAARSLLAEARAYTAFTVDAVAKRADVSRATIYYQFDSKTGLLEALCDDLAEAGRMHGLAAAFTTSDSTEALRRFVAAFNTFWAVGRPVMRRLRALSALDPEVGAVITGRDERRRAGLEVLVKRVPDDRLTVPPDRAVTMLFTLTSFETFEALAYPDRTSEEVMHEILLLVTTVVRPIELRKDVNTSP